MKDEEENKERFRGDAKLMIDSLFNNDLFKDRLTRDDMSALEDWINMSMCHRYDSYLRLQKILPTLNRIKKDNED
jgi:hypothetical protein